MGKTPFAKNRHINSTCRNLCSDGLRFVCKMQARRSQKISMLRCMFPHGSQDWKILPQVGVAAIDTENGRLQTDDAVISFGSNTARIGNSSLLSWVDGKSHPTQTNYERIYIYQRGQIHIRVRRSVVCFDYSTSTRRLVIKTINQSPFSLEFNRKQCDSSRELLPRPAPSRSAKHQRSEPTLRRQR